MLHYNYLIYKKKADNEMGLFMTASLKVETKVKARCMGG